MQTYKMSRSTAVLITFLMMIGLAILASSCDGNGPQVKYKGKVIGSSITHIVYDKEGYVVGDTIQIQLGYKYPKFVIQSIIK